MSRLTAWFIAFLLLSCSSVFAQDKHFKRVEEFPKDRQTGMMGSFLSGVKEVNVERYTFEVPYEKVWPAAKRAAQTLDKVGGRPIVAIDEQNGRIQNGRITQDALVGRGATAWLDEFLIEVTSSGQTQTKVAVGRKVVQQNSVDRQWKTYSSNGKLERWVLTLIEDELKNANAEEEAINNSVATGPPIDYIKSAPGKYVRKNTPADFIELNPDGSFFAKQGGRGFSGKFSVIGDMLTITLGNGMADRAKMRGDTLTFPSDGTIWVKQGGTPTASPAITPSNQSHETLTNAEIIRMAEAKLPDSIIIAKIKSSSCKFDLSTDSLIKLKQAGLSDGVIQAMVETNPK